MNDSWKQLTHPQRAIVDHIRVSWRSLTRCSLTPAFIRSSVSPVDGTFPGRGNRLRRSQLIFRHSRSQYWFAHFYNSARRYLSASLLPPWLVGFVFSACARLVLLSRCSAD